MYVVDTVVMQNLMDFSAVNDITYFRCPPTYCRMHCLQSVECLIRPFRHFAKDSTKKKV